MVVFLYDLFSLVGMWDTSLTNIDSALGPNSSAVKTIMGYISLVGRKLA